MAVKAHTLQFKNPTSTASAFGRLFFAVDSMVMFSQVPQSHNDVGRCYQINDPTSSEIPDLLDTDGGYVPIEESRNIKTLKAYKSGVLVFAGNGVWFIHNPETGFKATSFKVDKVTERGIESIRSVVEAEGALFYFSNNGIMQVTTDEFGNPRATDITAETIRTYFLDNFAGRGSQGVYDEAAKQVVWWNPDAQSQGLILDLDAGAFYPQQNASVEWKIGRPFAVNNFVFYPSYNEEGNLQYSLSSPSTENFQDFGIDQTAYMITGWETLGKFANSKRARQAKVFFKKTETQITGFDGSYIYDKPSACLFQSRWDYDNSAEYSKWVGRTTEFGGKGKKMNIYQPMQRKRIPDAYPYTFDTGEKVIKQKVAIRGSGDAVQFVFEAQSEKDLQLLGYSVTYDMGARM